MLTSLRGLRGGKGSGMNYLVAFGDTEGTREKNGLWSLTLVVAGVVNGPPTLSATGRNLPQLRHVKHCYHILNYNGQEGSDKATGKALSSHFHAVSELQKEYDAKGVLLCFWNANHDMRQIEPYCEIIKTSVPNLSFQYVCLLKFVRTLLRLPKYNLGYVRYDVYGSESERRFGAKQQHTSLQDTFDVLYVLHATILDSALEQTEYSSVQERKKRRNRIVAAVASSSKKLQMKTILNHEFFLIGLLEQESKTPLPIERKVSLNLLESVPKEKYLYFEISGESYKVRRGFESSTSVWYKNYGLYIAQGAQYKRILDKKRKKAILDMLLALETTETTE